MDMTEFWAVARTPVEDVEEYLPQITPTDRQSVVTLCLVLHSNLYPHYKVVPSHRFTLPRLPGMAEHITVFNWPSGPTDAPAPDRDAGSMMQLKFITPSLGIARAVDPEKRPLQGAEMFPGWGTSGPEAPWPPDRREGLDPAPAGTP
ncbi:hypothetical protein [Corynebacterium sp.]|uniref:hypothetical protein n=1 Tax=Corynebacterium sp. TaxID=1720 RepID=UPI0028AAC463|nr:hypothetical protein [Corynebacterium sp.]